MRGDQSVNSDLGESNQVGQREGACNWTYDNAHLYDERYYDRLADLFHPPERNPDRDIHLDDDNRMYYYSPSTEVRDVTVGAGVIAQKMRKVYGNQVDADLPQQEFLLGQMRWIVKGHQSSWAPQVMAEMFSFDPNLFTEF